MKMWNILETEEEVKACIEGKDAQFIGTITDPVTFQPHAYIKVGNAVFIVPMQLTLPK